MKLSECISFPKELEEQQNFDELYINGFNQSLKECKDAVDKMEVNEKEIYKILTEVLFTYKQKYMRGDKVAENCFLEQAKAIADNLPKLLKEKD